MDPYSPYPHREYGAVRLNANPGFPGQPRRLWAASTGQDTGFYLGLSPYGAVVGSCQSADSAYDPYGDPTGYTVSVLDLASGELRFRVDGQAVGLAGEVLVCRQPRPSTDCLSGYSLRDGRPLWEFQLPRKVDSDTIVASEGLYAKPAYEQPAAWKIPLHTEFHPWISEGAERVLRLSSDLIILPGRDAYGDFLSGYEGALARSLWWLSEGKIRAVLEVFRDRSLVWSLPVEDFSSSQYDVTLDRHGWVLGSPERTAAFSWQGQEMWSAPKFFRRWIGEDRLVCDAPLTVIDRLTGAARLLPELPSVSGVALCGEETWCLSRFDRQLACVGADGCVRWQAEIPDWNVEDFVAYGGRFYLRTNLGELVCYG